jgi:hypothetical protein
MRSLPLQQKALLAFTGAPRCTLDRGCELPTGILEIELVPPLR